MNKYEKKPNFKGKPSFKKWCNHCRRYGHSIVECRQKQQDNQNKPQKYKEPNKSFYQYIKKDKIYQTKMYTVITALENHFLTSRINRETNHYITQVTEVDLKNKEIHEVSYKIDIVDQIVDIIKIELTIHDRIQTEQILHLHPVPIQTLGIDTIPTIDHETHHTIEIEIIPTIGKEIIQLIEINNIKTTDQEIFHTTDQIIKDLVIVTKKDQETVHKIETQAITVDKEIIPNLLTGIITATQIHNTDLEALH